MTYFEVAAISVFFFVGLYLLVFISYLLWNRKKKP